jgi:hypothetical protein
LCQVKGYFCASSSFSQLHFKWDFVKEHDVKRQMEVGNLFNFDVNDIDVNDQGLQYIMDCKARPWPTLMKKDKMSEKDVLIVICTEILRNLCQKEDIILEKQYQKYCSKNDLKFRTENRNRKQ